MSIHTPPCTASTARSRYAGTAHLLRIHVRVQCILPRTHANYVHRKEKKKKAIFCAGLALCFLPAAQHRARASAEGNSG